MKAPTTRWVSYRKRTISFYILNLLRFFTMRTALVKSVFPVSNMAM